MIDFLTSTNQLTLPISKINSLAIFPTLRIVPIDKLVPHEHFDTTRSSALQKRLVKDEVLRNPPIVVPLQGAMGNYMVLDGANRTDALKMMKVPHILVQVACPRDSGFELSTWNQVVFGIESKRLISYFDGIEDVSLKKEQNTELFKGGRVSSILLQVILPSNEIYSVMTRSPDPYIRVELLNLILTRIRQYARLDRTHLDDLVVLRDLHPDLAGLVVFPCYEFDEIVKLAESGYRIPAGITRFLINPRALRVNYKISDLRSDRTLSEKNEMLMNWIKERVSQNGVRVYSETTVMFDE